MGWVGLGALIATACLVLYCYFPKSRAWAPTNFANTSPTNECRSESIAGKATSRTSASQSVLETVERASTVDGSNNQEDDSQSTPIACTADVPALPVDRLSQDDGDQTITETHLEHDSPSLNGATARREPHLAQTGGDNKPLAVPSAASSSSMMPPPLLLRLRPTKQQHQQQPTPRLAPPLSPAGRYPPHPAATNGSLRPPPSAAASLRAPPNSNRSTSGTLAPTQVTIRPPTSSSLRKVVLEPGFSPLDWAALTSNPNNKLRGVNLPPTLIRVTPSMLKAQKGRKGRDAWTSFQGKVYNITPYLPFHPGGKGELLRGAGRDSGKLFMEIHPWVNFDAIMGECLVGILVAESETTSCTENTLDAMD